MWPIYLIDRYKVVLLVLPVLCFISAHVEGKSTCRYTCQVGQEKNEDNQWRWVLPYEYPCECAKIVYGGTNIDRPKRPFKPMYVEEPMVGDNTGKIRDHYGLNCIELTCPSIEPQTAQPEQATANITWQVKEAVGNHGEALNVTCTPASRTNFSIGRTSITCGTCDRRGNHKNCTFTVQVIDFDECKTNTHECSSNATCSNTDGSYKCSCNVGYEGDGHNCTDIDECENDDRNNCDANAYCENTEGSFKCSCNQGFNGDGVHCEDVNECTTNSHDCSLSATCKNTDGSYRCTCNEGYGGDEFNCEDFDECTTNTHECSSNATCINTDGSYNCTCNDGYRGDGRNCTDIDECSSTAEGHNCHIETTCSNTIGSYNCVCNSGYTGDGVSCTDIDQCNSTTEGHTCHPEATCFNTVGSYNCSCNTGYMGDGVSCEDINECSSTIEGHTCHKKAICSNHVGSYSCLCSSGYIGDGFSCTDIDECMNEGSNCHANAECINNQGSFSCLCNNGYIGDEVDCQAGPCFLRLGVEDRRITDNQLTASSEWSSNHGASNARPNRPAQSGTTGAWSAKFNNISQWIQVHLGDQKRVTGVLLQGREDYRQWVIKFKVEYSDDGGNWDYVQTGNGGEMEFDGNVDQNVVVSRAFPSPVKASFIRIRPTGWHGHISLRFELLGCKGFCYQGLGLEDGRISNNQLTASSAWDGSRSSAASYARLNRPAHYGTTGAWCAAVKEDQWIQASLGDQQWVTGVLLQGRQDLDQWVTKFKVEYSDDGVNWRYILQEANQDVMEFNGNTDQNTVTTNHFPWPVKASFIRIQPIAWTPGTPCLRFELIGCEAHCSDEADWITFGDHQYCFAHTPDVSYTQAEAECERVGANLVSIHSQEEQDFIAANTMDISLNSDGWWGYWIGLNDLATEGTHVWTDGTETNYVNWYTDEPNNNRGSQDCVVLSPRIHFFWHDSNCNLKARAYICKKQP